MIDAMTTQAEVRKRRATLTRAGIVLGIGLGAFVDGIAFHQVAQWHNMLSSTERWPVTTIEGMKANTRGDGLFHAFAFGVVLVGIWMLWNALRGGAHGSGRSLVGWMIVGFGIFNVVEGIADHHILGLHHVNEGTDELAWDLGFLAISVGLIAGGWLLARDRVSSGASTCPMSPT
jgi:uncharacterized membrane protein